MRPLESKPKNLLSLVLTTWLLRVNDQFQAVAQELLIL